MTDKINYHLGKTVMVLCRNAIKEDKIAIESLENEEEYLKVALRRDNGYLSLVSEDRIKNINSVDELITAKESIISTIKKIFKTKHSTGNSKLDKLLELKDKGENEIKLNKNCNSEIYTVVNFLYSLDLVDEYKPDLLLEKVIEYKNKLNQIEKNDFKIENMVSENKIERLGYSINDKIPVLNNKKVSELINNHFLKDIMKKDKQLGLDVEEYRFIPIGYVSGWDVPKGYDGFTFYVLKYFTLNNVNFMFPAPSYLGTKIKIKTKITNVKFKIDDLIEFFKNLTFHNSLIETPSIKAYEESSGEEIVELKNDIRYLESIKNKDRDFSILFKLQEEVFGDFDFYNEYIEDEFDLKDIDINLVKYRFNIGFGIYYDVIEQYRYGNLSMTDYVEYCDID